jgi:plasmid maintenance system killer protein
MILSYRDKRTQQFADGEFVRAFQGFERQAWKRLDILDAATSIADLRNLPGNRLEALHGDPDRAVFHSHQSAMENLLHLAGWRAWPVRC